MRGKNRKLELIMGILENIQLTLQSIGIKDNFKKSIFFVFGVIALDLLLITFNYEIENFSPLLAVILSWIWFLLPGIVLSYVLVNRVAWWERIAISFGLALGAATPITIIAILLRLELNYFIFLHTLILTIISLILVIYNTRVQEANPPSINFSRTSFFSRIDKVVFALLIITALLVGLLATLAREWPASGDDVAGLPIFAEVIRLNQITGTEPFHGTGEPVTPRNELIVWTYLAILTDKISGTSPLEFFTNSRPVLIILAILSIATFLNQILKDKRKTLFILNIWCIYLLATTISDGIGSDFITRIIQDKFLGWFVVIPIVLVFMLWFVQSQDWRKLIGYGIVIFGASMVHPITLTQAMIVIGGFGLFHLIFDRSRGTFVNLLIIAFVTSMCTIIPFVQYVRYVDLMPVDLAGLRDAVEFGRLSSSVGRYRLWLLEGNRYILHPSVALKPTIILAYLLLPVVVLQMKKHILARFIVGVLLLLALLLYIPYLAGLAGRVVTPYLLWRLAWPLPFFTTLTIGWVSLLLIEDLKGRFGISKEELIFNTIAPMVLILIALISYASNIKSGLQDYSQRRAEIHLSTCYVAEPVLSFLNDLSKEQAVNVMSSRNLNLCIPGFAAMANVVEFRGLGTVNRLSEDDLEGSLQRIEDINYFNVATIFDLNLMDAINRHDIDYILIPKERMELDFQIRNQPSSFHTIYEDDEFNLYEVNKPLSPTKIIEGNTALNFREFREATEIFQQVLKKDPSNVLANLGLGLAQEGLGEIESAKYSYQNALVHSPNEPALHAQLAGSFLLERNFEDSIDAYQTAISISPESESLYTSLGQVYILAGLIDEANNSFEKVATLRASKDSAAYYSVLGRLYQSANLLPDALAYYEKAIALEENSQHYIDLARTLASSGKIDEAIASYQEAIRLDRWNYLPHLDLGYLFKRNGQIDNAIAEYEIACRLKPTNISGYILLGEAIQEKSGLSTAIAKLEEFQDINKVLPGPYRGLATLMIAQGEFVDAFQLLNLSGQIQPKSAAIMTAKGYLLMANNQLENAHEEFGQALATNPNSVSAHLGLSLLYNLETGIEKETGEFLKIIRLTPTASWAHIKLAEAFQRQGNFVAARGEINWALELDPTNVDGYIASGDLNNAESNWELAISDYLEALELDPNNIIALMNLGELYHSLANYSNAEEIYQTAITSDPESIYPYMKLAELYWEQGRFEEASAIEEKAVVIAPDSDLALVKLANLYKLQGRIDEARSIYERVIQADPGVIAAYAALAQIAAEENNDQNVIINLYNEALNANPGSAEAHLAAGRFFISQGHFDFATSSLQSALSFPDVTPENYLALSELQKKLGARSEALKTLQMGTNIFQGHAIAFHNLAIFYLNNGEPDQAKQHFLRAIELNPKLIPAYIGLSNVHLMNGNYLLAEEILQDALRINPRIADAYVALANFHEFIGQPGLAEANLELALQLMPTDTDVLQSLAQFYFNQKRYEEAKNTLYQALELPGSKIDIYLNLANYHVLLNQFEQAVELYEEAIQLDKSDVRPYLGIASVHQSREEWNQALEKLNTALNIQPEDISANLAMGNLFTKLGQFDDGVIYFQQAKDNDLSQISAQIMLANFYSDRGNLQQAILYLKEAIEISPTNLDSYILLAQLYQLSGDQTQANLVISQGLDKSIDKSRAYLARAKLNSDFDNIDLAKSDYESAWNLIPYSTEVGLDYSRFLQGLGDLEGALNILNQLEKHQDETAETKVEISNIYLAQNNLDEAIKGFNQAIQLDNTNLDAYLGLAQTYEKLGEIETALEVYQSAENNNPKNVEILLSLADVYKSRGLYSKALTIIEDTLIQEPNSVVAYVKLDQLSRMLDLPEVDLSLLTRRADASPSSDAFITLSHLYRQRGNWRIAQSWIQKAISLEPLNSKNWIELGNYYRSLAQWDLANNAYKNALEYQPNSTNIWLALGGIQRERGMFDEAIESYVTVIEVDPKNIEGYVELAQLQYQLGETDEAIATINEGISQVPNDPRGYQVLGDLYSVMNKFSLAKDTYLYGLELFPNDSNLYTRIGDLHTDIVLGASNKLETAKSLELLAQYRVETILDQKATASKRREKRASELKLDNAMNDYANFHSKLIAAQQQLQLAGVDFEFAKANYEQALNFNPNNDLALLGLGKLHLALGFDEEALKYLRQASAANPNSSLILGYLGNILLEKGFQEDAIATFQKLLILEPMNIFAHLGLSKAYNSLGELNITQAAKSVNHRQFSIKFLVDYYRVEE